MRALARKRQQTVRLRKDYRFKARLYHPSQIHGRRARQAQQVILYIERNPKLVRSIASFPYIVNSL